MNLLKRKLSPFIILILGFSAILFLIFIQQKSKIPTDWKVQSNPGIITASADIIPTQEQTIISTSQIQINSPFSLNNKIVSKVGNPVRLKIPSIKVDSIVEYVGLTPLGAMDSPVGPAEVGWYMLGPKPGDIGSAVIDGHSGWRNDIPAVFDDLYKVKIGDKIYVEDNMGATITFVVREVKIYNPNADASDVFVSNDGKSHLNLITCTGIWNNILKSRSDRLIVFADKE